MKLRPLSVTEVNAYIKRSLSYDPILSNLIVEGELSGFKLHSSGHAYFNLKDNDSRISCVMFHRDFSNVDFKPADGMKIKAKGYISVYERDGKYQLYVKSLEQSGLGDLHIKFEKLKQALADEGLFDEVHKKRVPSFPERIAVITSPTGAAVRDIIQVLSRRVSYSDITIFPARVQGEQAHEEISAALKKVNEIGGFDVIITGRGGGSIEDLWAFNEITVAREIFDSEIPVISGVGHETDFTIADFVADLRAPTPSAAAEVAAVSNLELVGYLNAFKDRLSDALRYKADLSRETLDRYQPQTLADRLSKLVDMKRYEIEVTRDRFQQGMKKQIEFKRQELVHTGKLLDHISPLKTLERGYSLAENDQGHVVSSISDIHENDKLTIRMADGSAKVAVESIQKSED
jgi:exodeoxyribonuclease VII large subunit